MIKHKFIAVILIVLTMAVLFAGCATMEYETDNSKGSMFVVVEETVSFCVVYHKETKVMYALSYGHYNSGTFTLLVNADGTPMLWEG